MQQEFIKHQPDRDYEYTKETKNMKPLTISGTDGWRLTNVLKPYTLNNRVAWETVAKEYKSV